MERLLTERKLKLEKQKEQRDIAERAERKAQVEARKASVTGDPTSAKAKQQSYAEQQKQRKREAQAERERILRQIEHDKQERREREERRKATAKAEAEAVIDVDGGLEPASSENESKRVVSSQSCALQIRLFDGSTIRKKFPSDQTLVSHIRPWVVETTSSRNIPYTFKQILTPLPNRSISEEAEEQTLADLGLTPSSTLVLVPIQGFTTAYAGEQGAISRGFSTIYSAVAAILGTILKLLGTFLNGGQPTSPAGTGEEQSQRAAATGAEVSPLPPGDTKIRVRTLHDQRREQDNNEFYNGNQVSLSL